MRIWWAVVAICLVLARPLAADPGADVRTADLKTIQSVLHSHRGQVVVVYFFATWCAPCAQELPDLVTLQSRYGAKGVQVIAISTDDEKSVDSKVVPFLAPFHVNFPVFVASGDNSALVRWFSPSWLGEPPSAFVYNRKGVLAKELHGRQTLSDYEGIISTLL